MTLMAGVLCLAAACKMDKFLDVNKNPNAPTDVSANLYLAPMIHWMITSPQFDGRYVGALHQEMVLHASNTLFISWGRWDTTGSDAAAQRTTAAQQWRDVYWSLGQNLVDMMTKAEAEQRWDLLGVGYVPEGVGLAGAHRPAR